MRWVLWIWISSWALSWSGRAFAFERQWHLGAGLGAGSFMHIPGSVAPFGVGLGLPVFATHAAYGVSDMFDARLDLTWGTHSLDGTPAQPKPELQTTEVVTLTAGCIYKMDIIEWVPSLGLLGGYTLFAGGPGLGKNQQLDPAQPGQLTLKLSLGLDYAFTRAWAAGVQLGYHGFLGDLPTSLQDAAYLTALLQLEHTWGY